MKLKERFDYLLPLRNEMKRKKLDLNLICPELSEEIIEIRKIRDLLTDDTFNII